MINSFPFIILILDESPIDLLKLPYQGIKKLLYFFFPTAYSRLTFLILWIIIEKEKTYPPVDLFFV